MHQENAAGFAKPINPARAWLRGNHVDIVAFDIRCDEGTAQPERRGGNQRNDHIEGIGEGNLHEAGRRIVSLDGQRQADDAEKNQREKDEEDL